MHFLEHCWDELNGNGTTRTANTAAPNAVQEKISPNQTNNATNIASMNFVKKYAVNTIKTPYVHKMS